LSIAASAYAMNERTNAKFIDLAHATINRHLEKELKK
jgi:hypothetical protein